MKTHIKHIGKLFEKSIKYGLNATEQSFLWQMLKKTINFVEEEQHLNFIRLLRNFNILKGVLDGTIESFYKSRKALWFKHFFVDIELYKLVREDLERLYPQYKHVIMTITKRGLLVYDNYQKNHFNTLVLTIHGGTWIDKDIRKKMLLDDKIKTREEDVATDRIYGPLALERGGIWIDNKQSRFLCDFNRKPAQSIYYDKSEEWLGDFWKDKLLIREQRMVLDSYKQFYFMLSKLIDTYRFNIIYDGHSMKNIDGRPKISFGVKYVPSFYMPIVYAMQKKFEHIGKRHVLINKPFKGGFILKWLSKFFPDIFIFSMEINKCLYMDKTEQKVLESKVKELSKEIIQIFD